jgi:hypothetical protein
MPTKGRKNTKKKPEYITVIAIEWIDATGSVHDTPDAEPTPMLTFGVLLEDTKKKIKIASEVWADGGKRTFHQYNKQLSGMNPRIRKVGRIKVPASFFQYRKIAGFDA